MNPLWHPEHSKLRPVLEPHDPQGKVSFRRSFTGISILKTDSSFASFAAFYTVVQFAPYTHRSCSGY